VNLETLPLAITMMAGPQIMSAILFVTTAKAVRNSVAFVGAVALAATVGVTITRAVASTLDLGEPSDNGSTGHIIQYVLVALLVLAALKNWRQRATIEPPKWLGALMEADARKAFLVGFALILAFPSDVIVLFTVGVNLAHNDHGVVDAWPFLGLTTLIAALPLLVYLVFHRRAVEAMPKAREWMNSHSWLINIIACAIFIVLIIG
jgi:hypothetical protein